MKRIGILIAIAIMTIVVSVQVAAKTGVHLDVRSLPYTTTKVERSERWNVSLAIGTISDNSPTTHFRGFCHIPPSSVNSCHAGTGEGIPLHTGDV